jgi:hypothetical protein
MGWWEFGVVDVILCDERMAGEMCINLRMCIG